MKKIGLSVLLIFALHQIGNAETSGKVADSAKVGNSKTEVKAQESGTTKIADTLKDNSKDGWFVGVEMDLGSASAENPTHQVTAKAVLTSPTIDGGLVGGYQFYFKDHPDMGIKFSGHLYLGYVDFDDKNSISMVSTAFETVYAFHYSYVPIRVGFDVKYLWDFFKQGDHTLGLNAGIGYQMNFYTFGDYEVKTSLSKSNDKMAYLFSDDLYPILGLHYYYKHHQVEVMYRFGGIGKKEAKGTENSDTGFQTFRIFNKRSYLTLNYAYRF